MNQPLQITISDIKLNNYSENQRLKAFVTILINGVFAVHRIKVIQGPSRIFVAMPSVCLKDGSFRDVAHPIEPGLRSQIEDLVLDAYDELTKQDAA